MEEDKTNADTEVQAGADRNSAETDQGVSLNPICQEELYDPGRNVSINPNKDSILTLKRPVPDVRLGYTSTRHLLADPKFTWRTSFSVS